jgi:hypothetical protein
MGWIGMSAKIVRFIPRKSGNTGQTDFPTIAFCPVPRPDDLTMDHVDTSPCEYVPPSVMPDAVPGMRVLTTCDAKDVDRRDEPGHEEL